MADGGKAVPRRFASTGNHPARIVSRPQIVLELGTSGDIEQALQRDITERYEVSRAAVSNVKRNVEESGLDRLLSRKKRKTPQKAGDELEAHLIALSCMEPPPGYGRWTARLLADKCVELDPVSYLIVSLG